MDPVYCIPLFRCDFNNASATTTENLFCVDMIQIKPKFLYTYSYLQEKIKRKMKICVKCCLLPEYTNNFIRITRAQCTHRSKPQKL